jgi:hypothetical protein
VSVKLYTLRDGWAARAKQKKRDGGHKKTAPFQELFFMRKC